MANIVVTGASRGLGLEFVKQLSKFSKTPTVFALCRNPDKAEKLQDVAHTCPNVKIVRADMIEFDQYQEVVSKIHANIQSGGVNLLINNAGMMLKDKLTSVTKENILDSFHLNSVAPVLFAKALYPLLKAADNNAFPLKVGKSAILNISAHLGSIEENTTGDYLSYRISKAAVNMVTKTLAMELKPSDIFVMALHPGWVKTDMGGKAAPLTPEQSVNGMLTVLAKAEESQRGCLFNNRGKRIPW
ncbi:C-factor-like isoform X1 [Uloborus diversus]|uniref:C-factor-like isoform X1 n=1 Tax=Uloborus diversus TaxID=327109 RepID=UPI002409B4B5|nr:C-factor-like isoform X1 [Uloborus diversus]